MSLTQATLDAAAFWHEHICLECGTTQVDPHSPGEACDACGSPQTVSAQALLSAITDLEEAS